MRLFLVTAQAVFLGLGYFIVAVLAAPFTAEGLVGTPSRMAGGVFIVTRMPLDGPTLLSMAKPLLCVPALSLALAFLAGFPKLRSLRWAGVLITLAGLGYLANAFPSLLSFKAVPWPLMVLLLLFSGSALLFALLPRTPDAAFTRSFAMAAQIFLWIATLGLLWYGATRQSLPTKPLAVTAVCTAIYCLAFYSLLRAVWGKISSAEPAVWGLIAVILAVFAWFHSPPMAFPLFAGIAVWLTAALPS